MWKRVNRSGRGRTRRLGNRRPVLALAACLGLAVGLLACGDQTPVPPRSLASPAGIGAARFCTVEVEGVESRVAASRCEEGGDLEALEGVVSTFGVVANRQRQSLMLMTLDDRLPGLVDTERAVPGVTGIPICNGPRDVGVTPDGLFAVVLCDVGRQVSIVDLSNLDERARLDRPTAEVDLQAFPDSPRFVSARPEWEAVVVERLAFDCDGVGDRLPRGCTPDVSLDIELVLTTPGRPSHLVAAPGGDFFVTYQDKGYLSRFALDEAEACLDGSAAAPCEVSRVGLTFECRDGVDNDGDGLIDQGDPQCFRPNGAESSDGLRGRRTACTDGVDNDDDGQVDHDDLDCLADIDDNEGGGVVPVACSDGDDNDGDGLVDAEDPECVSPDSEFTPSWTSERSAPACGDGEDNDNDGAVDFPDDEQCPNGLWSSEETAPADETQNACNNGVDDDLDGFADAADPGCSGPRDDSEAGPTPVCSDGADNDDDGLVDLDDPDCYGPTGSTEVTVGTGNFGPMGWHQGGEYLLVGDQSRHQVMIVDLRGGVGAEALIDTGDGDALHPGLGLPVSNGGVIAPSLAYEIVSDEELDDGTRNAFTEQIGVVPVSDGFGVIVDLVSVASSEPPDGEAVEEPMPRFRPRDGLFARATAGELDCELPDDYRDAVREARGPDGVLRVACSDPEVPRLAVIDEGDPGDPDDDEQVVLVSEPRFTFDEADQLVSEVAPIDWRLRDEVWTLTWEGALPDSDRTDGLIDEEIDGLVVSRGVDYCSLGVEVGDRIVIDEASPTLDVEEGACDAFIGTTANPITLEYVVDAVRADALYLGLTDESGHAAELPSRECFSEGFAYEVRAGEAWLVEGSRSGYIHDRTSLSEQCVAETNDAQRIGRVFDGVPFQNAFFEIEIDPATVRQTRDTSLTFSVENNFATTILDIGPAPRDITLSQTAQGLRLSISDGGINTVFIFNAETLLAIVNVI